MSLRFLRPKLDDEAVRLAYLSLLSRKMFLRFRDCGLIIICRQLYNGIDVAHIKHKHAIVFHRSSRQLLRRPLQTGARNEWLNGSQIR